MLEGVMTDGFCTQVKIAMKGPKTKTDTTSPDARRCKLMSKKSLK